MYQFAPVARQNQTVQLLRCRLYLTEDDEQRISVANLIQHTQPVAYTQIFVRPCSVSIALIMY
jgi:hypothetical protein